MSHCISGLPHDISSACGIASQQCYVLCQQPSPARQPGHLVLLATQDVSCWIAVVQHAISLLSVAHR